MKISSIQIGKPRSVHWQGKEISTGIFKSPITHPIHVGFTNLDGDGQADLNVHGGIDKAVYAYGLDAYEEWKKIRPREKWELGIFGENLTLDVLDESQAFIGDIYQVGDCELQVVQPRMPCFKLGIRFNDNHVIKQFMDSNRPGIYYRVLKEGRIAAGDAFKKIGNDSTNTIGATIQELFEIARTRIVTPDRAKELVKIKSLSSYWKSKLEMAAE